MRFRQRLLVVASLCALSSIAYVVKRAAAGGIPTSASLAYSGTLTDPTGALLTGERAIQVFLWSSATPGDKPLCNSMSGKTYPLQIGRFSVPLPDDCVDAVKSNSDVWAEVLVDGVTLGVTKIGAMPYAITAGQAVSATGALAAQIDELSKQVSEPRTYMYEGALATPTEWEADVISNQNYKRFCTALGQQFVEANELLHHHNTARTNGFYYKGWYYAGPRGCDSDTVYVGLTSDPTNQDSVWKYSGDCGYSGESSSWTIETRALITCRP